MCERETSGGRVSSKPILLTPTGPPIEDTDEALILDRNPRVRSPVAPFILTVATIAVSVLLLKQTPPRPFIKDVFLKEGADLTYAGRFP